MTTSLPALVFAASLVSAGALADLRRLAGPAGDDLPQVVRVSGAPASASAPAPVAAIRVSDAAWNPAFPLPKAAVDAAGLSVFTKAFTRYACEYVPGAAAVRCDFAYDVWPEICWYGYDHVVVDLPVAGGEPTVVSREWRRN